jgi:hypothetical protein
MLEPLEAAFGDTVVWTTQPMFRRAHAPDSYTDISDYALVGTAFDFWLRALLCIEYGAREEETTLDIVADMAERGPAIAELSALFPAFVNLSGQEEPLLAAVNRVRGVRMDSIGGRAIYSDAFFGNCIDAARLEGFYRSGRCSPPATRETLDDLKNVARLAWKSRQLFDGNRYDLNPQFPYFGPALGGCDADFAIDDLLLEIKTTNRALPDNVGSQVVAYAHLDSIEQRLVGREPRWTRVGVYAARYGVLCSAPLAAFEAYFPLLESAIGIEVSL